MRPLELAASLGTFGLLRSIFETPGVYLIKNERNGLYYHRLYDITDYERLEGNYCRNIKSPLHLLSYMDREKLKDPLANSLAKWGVLQKWTNSKFNINKPLIFLWFIIRAWFAVFFILLSMSIVIDDEKHKKLNPHTGKDEKDGVLNITAADDSKLCNVTIPVSVGTFHIIIYMLLTDSFAIMLLDIYEFIWWSIKR